MWVFCGGGDRGPSGVFTDEAIAHAWIKKHRLTGTLTDYPLNVGVYDWTIENGYFKPRYPSQKSPEFIGKFTSAYLPHHHFEDGELQA